MCIGGKKRGRFSMVVDKDKDKQENRWRELVKIL